jgi:hypothetical protein
MGKVLDLDATVYSLCEKYSELAGILHDIGLSDITKPGMLNTAGRFMTLNKGATMKKIPLETIVRSLREHGYDVLERKVSL